MNNGSKFIEIPIKIAELKYWIVDTEPILWSQIATLKNCKGKSSVLF